MDSRHRFLAGTAHRHWRALHVVQLLGLLWLFSFSHIASSQAQARFQVSITAYGLFEALGDHNDREVASTAAGKVAAHDSSRHVETTTTLKARRGVTFGFKYQVRGLDDGQHEGFAMRAVHPAMIGPSGRASTVSEAPVVLFSDGGVAEDDLFYILSKDFEVLPGEWRLEVLYRGQVVVSKTFTLT
jgi:Domain of unknown function (DUF3859)